MRELHGVLSIGITDYKPYAFLFDKLHVFGLERYRLNNEESPEIDRISADLAFLEKSGFIQSAPIGTREGDQLTAISQISQLTSAGQAPGPEVRDVIIRHLAPALPIAGADVVPICEAPFPKVLAPSKAPSSTETVLNIALQSMPLPNANSAWQDILDFKSESRDKKWSFRRFLRDLASKPQTEAEIRDDIEWSLNEYREAMTKRGIKMVQGAIGACVIPAADILFTFPGNHIASVLGAAVVINKIRVELLEAEMKAPGRECAYVFDARQRFGAK